MKYYDIHTHKGVDSVSDENVISIHNLSQEEMINKSLIKKHGLFYSCGIHPWNVEGSQISIEELQKLATNNRIIAIGEVGLDKLIDAPMELQKRVFSDQIKLAIELNLPMIIHCVKAWDELITLYKKYKSTKPWIIHGFRGGKDQAAQLIKVGFYLSIGEFYNPDSLAAISPNRLFIETDESHLNIQNVYERLVKDIPCDIDELCMMIRQNVSLTFDSVDFK